MEAATNGQFRVAGRPRRAYHEAVESLESMVAAGQALWASKTIKLAPEPPGDRFGTVGGQPSDPLSLVAVGDSLIAGSGTDHQSRTLTPFIASRVSARSGRPVSWQTHAQLGATLRRVRYRFLPETPEDLDLLVVCAGTNDVLARRSIPEWEEDLEGTLDAAQDKAKRVLLLSSGQPHHSPALPSTLKKVLARSVAEQTEASRPISDRRGVPFLDMTNIEVPGDFWASDGFHPSQAGYDFAAELIADLLYPPRAD